MLGVLGGHAEVRPHPHLCSEADPAGAQRTSLYRSPNTPGVLISNMQESQALQGAGIGAGRYMACEGRAEPGLLCLLVEAERGREVLRPRGTAGQGRLVG